MMGQTNLFPHSQIDSLKNWAFAKYIILLVALLWVSLKWELRWYLNESDVKSAMLPWLSGQQELWHTVNMFSSGCEKLQERVFVFEPLSQYRILWQGTVPHQCSAHSRVVMICGNGRLLLRWRQKDHSFTLLWGEHCKNKGMERQTLWWNNAMTVASCVVKGVLPQQSRCDRFWNRHNRRMCEVQL